MNSEERKKLKELSLKRDKLHDLSRLQKIIKDPKSMIPFSFYWLIAKYVRPIKVNYKTLWGEKMRFYIPEGQEIMTYGFFEIYLFNFLINFVQEGDIVVDIGAHVGIYTKLMSRLVGDSGRVYAFEPTYRTFNTLRENTRYDKNVVTNNFALLNEEKKIIFKDYGKKFSFFNGFKERNDDIGYKIPKPKDLEIQAIALDSYFQKNKIEVCKFIKIDAEGAESLILEGMDNILHNFRPVISIEVGWGEKTEKNNIDSINYLLNKDYFGFNLDKDGFLHKHIVKDTYTYDNLIFVHKDNIDELNYLIR